MTHERIQPGISALRNIILHGECIHTMRQLPPRSMDFILTDPPYLVNYRLRDGRTIRNDSDNDADWLAPAFAQMHRVLKDDAICITTYGLSTVESFAAAWREAGFRTIGHVAFIKRYASAGRYMSYRHECAYVLAKGRPPLPAVPVPDVIDFDHTGNRLHPTQKPVSALRPLIEGLSPPRGLVLDPFCGSGSTLVAARELGRDWLGIELDAKHHATAVERLSRRCE